ncbi:MAG: LURP-one-related/scramblase family protein [Candidatus Nanohalobium sp.]
MEKSDIREYAEESLKEGYTKEELIEVLKEEGFEEGRIEGVLDYIDDEKFSEDLNKSSISVLELDEDQYTVKQKLIRNKYKVLDPEGKTVLKASQKVFRPKENITFKTGDGEPAFEIDAEQVLDISGDYSLKDSETGETFAVLQKKFQLLQHKWKLKEPSSEKASVVITSRGKIVGLLRSISDLFSLLPHKYTIETPEGEKIGEIEGKFSIGDKYVVKIDDSREIPREALIAAAVSIDALEGN